MGVWGTLSGPPSEHDNTPCIPRETAGKSWKDLGVPPPPPTLHSVSTPSSLAILTRASNTLRYPRRSPGGSLGFGAKKGILVKKRRLGGGTGA